MSPTVRDEIRVIDRFPLIVVEFVGAPDDAEFESYLARLDAIWDKQSKVAQPADLRAVVLFDTTEATRPVTAKQRGMQAAHVRRTQARMPPDQDNHGAVCFVIANTLVRGVLTAILWLQPMRVRHKVCATRAEADQWCRSFVLGTVGHPSASENAI